MARFHFYPLFFFVMLALATSSSASIGATADDVQQRQEAMVQALGVVTRFNLGLTNNDAEAVSRVKRALAVLNREVEANPKQWKPIFKALEKVVDTGADDRSREEASSVAKELLEQEFGPSERWFKRVLGVEDL